MIAIIKHYRFTVLNWAKKLSWNFLLKAFPLFYSNLVISEEVNDGRDEIIFTQLKQLDFSSMIVFKSPT
jgi:hypothetical protein